MAFDNVFQGPPEGVNAPGTAQSPSLGVDVTNKELYVSSGNGWEQLGGGGGGGGNLSGTLTPGTVPIATGEHTLADSSIQYGIGGDFDGWLLIKNDAVNSHNGIELISQTDTGAEVIVENFDTGGVLINSNSGSLSLASSNSISILNTGSDGTNISDGSAVLIRNTATSDPTGDVSILNYGQDGISISDEYAGSDGAGISITSNTSGISIEAVDQINIENSGSSGTIITDSGSGVNVTATGLGGAVNLASGTQEIEVTNTEVAVHGPLSLVNNAISSQVVNDNAGQITLVAGSGSYTFTNGPVSGGYASAPVVITEDITTPANNATKVVTVTGTSITITNVSGATDTYNFIAWPYVPGGLG